jgi:single-stranded DNA-binding protein
MNSFTLICVGRLARNPHIVVDGEITFTRFCLVGQDFLEMDSQGNAVGTVTSLWLDAHGVPGKLIADEARKGDQLILMARVQSKMYADKMGDDRQSYSLEVRSFRFGERKSE